MLLGQSCCPEVVGCLALSVDVTVFAICYLENCTKGSFTLGVRDLSVKSPNIMLATLVI
jgi:hypothetical protein